MSLALVFFNWALQKFGVISLLVTLTACSCLMVILTNSLNLLKCWDLSRSKLLDILLVFPKEFFEKLILKKSTDNQKPAKNLYSVNSESRSCE